MSQNLYLTVPIYVCDNYLDSDPYYSQQHVLSILFQVGGNACIWGGLAQQSPCFWVFCTPRPWMVAARPNLVGDSRFRSCRSSNKGEASQKRAYGEAGLPICMRLFFRIGPSEGHIEKVRCRVVRKHWVVVHHHSHADWLVEWAGYGGIVHHHNTFLISCRHSLWCSIGAIQLLYNSIQFIHPWLECEVGWSYSTVLIPCYLR